MSSVSTGPESTCSIALVKTLDVAAFDLYVCLSHMQILSVKC